MKLKIASNDNQSMSQDGDAILRSLQNKSLPVVDLMVRESLQNSLDATRPGSKTTRVDFQCGEFESRELVPFFEEIEEELLRNFSGQQRFLAVSDKNTTGLTGNYRSNKTKDLENSNFQKLVFGIGKNQDKAGAGGSWGLGKTSYFRIGIGIVIYYTRITTDTGFEERLIASLIESPRNKKRLLKKSERGIGWWGEYDLKGEKIYPVTDPKVINDLLRIFKIKRYAETDTGTTIIIPYLNNLVDNNCLETENIDPWKGNLEAEIRMSIQRWYSPRLENITYHNITRNSLLVCSVNKLGINPLINMEPIFKILQNLYSSALQGQETDDNITVKAIKLPRKAMANREEPVGFIAFCEVSREDLKMTPPNNKPSGLTYIGVSDKEKVSKNISKVIAYARKPGMIVEYDVDGDWTPNGLIQQDDHLLIGFFVPNSRGKLNDKFENLGYPNLESYVRATENADHAKWVDEDGISIIQRIKSYTAKAIQESYQSDIDVEQGRATSALSRKFGQLLMPPDKFGKSSTIKSDKKKKKTVSNSRNRVSDIVVLGSSPKSKNEVEVQFRTHIKKESTSEVYFQILTQDQRIDRDSWEKSMGNHIEFPFEISDVNVKTIDDEIIIKSLEQYDGEEVKFKLDNDKKDSFEIISKVPAEILIEGSIDLIIHSDQYQPNLAIRSKAH